MLRAKETFHYGADDGTRTITKGDLIEDGDDLVKGREHLFEPAAEAEPKPIRARRTPAKPAARKTES